MAKEKRQKTFGEKLGGFIKGLMIFVIGGAIGTAAGYYIHYKTGGYDPVDNWMDKVPGIKREVEETQARVQAQIAKNQAGFVITNAEAI